MKIKDLVKQIFQNGPLPQSNMNYDYLLNEQYISLFKNQILECDEFKNVTNFNVGSINDLNNFVSIKLTDNLVFKNTCQLYSIYLSPPTFNPDLLRLGKSVKNGAMITPTHYDEETFTPIKQIRLNWSPELSNDVSSCYLPQEICLREKLHEILDDILDNPKDYEIKMERAIILRGIFDYDVKKDDNLTFVSL